MKKAGKTETKRAHCRACKKEQVHQLIDGEWCCWYCGEVGGPMKDEKTARTPGVQRNKRKPDARKVKVKGE